MTCPRCGLDNPAGARSCQRCALPLDGAGAPVPRSDLEPGPLSHGSAPTPAAKRASASASILLGVAAVICLAYAAWAFSMRRGVFAALTWGDGVSVDSARTSDVVTTVGVVVAAVVAVAALVLWAWRGRRSTRGSVDVLEVTGLVVTLLGAAVVIVGLSVGGASTGVSGVRDAAHLALVGTLVGGVGFVIVAVGLATALVAIRTWRVNPPP